MNQNYVFLNVNGFPVVPYVPAGNVFLVTHIAYSEKMILVTKAVGNGK